MGGRGVVESGGEELLRVGGRGVVENGMERGS